MIDWTFNVPNLFMWIGGMFAAYLFIRYRDYLFTKRENRQTSKQLQDWFEETYIINGLETVLSYISNIIITDAIAVNLKHNWNSTNPHIDERTYILHEPFGYVLYILYRCHSII